MSPRSKQNISSSVAMRGGSTATSDVAKLPLHLMAFPEPILREGKRALIKYFDPTKSTYQTGKVLTACEHHNDEVERAYLHIEHKRIRTGLGYVDVCYVLTRDNDAASDSHNAFRLTDEIVIVKVSKKRTLLAKLKGIAKRKSIGADNPRMEVAAMQLIGNDLSHVTGLLDVLQDTSNKSLNLILPYYSGGSLQCLVSSEKYNPCEIVVRNYFRHIMKGLKQLHCYGLCHRDLSLENVMLDGDQCVLIDLGMSLRMPSDDSLQERLMEPQDRCGKLGYISPEIFRNKDAFDGEKVDVWSAGIILYEMLTGVGSYTFPIESDEIYKIMTDPMLLSNQLKKWGVHELSNQAMDLIHKMLEKDPRKRLTVEEVLKHPWLDN